MPPSPEEWPGGLAGQGVALPRSVPLPSLGGQQSGCPWRRSDHGGRGPHTAPVPARLLSLGAVRVASLCAGAGLLVHRDSSGSRRPGARRRALLRPPPPGRRGPSGGRGDRPLCLGGVGGPAPARPAGQWGGVGGRGGGGVAPWFSTSLPRPPFVAVASPRGVRVQPGSWGSPGRRARPAAGGSAWRGGGGGGGAACVPPSPEEWPGGPAGRGVALPRSVPLPSLGGQQSGCHWRRSGHGGRGPHTAPVRVCVPPPGVVRVSSMCAGAGSPACRGRGRQWGAWGRAACGLSCVPPRSPRPLRGEEGRPLCLGGVEGRRPRGPQAGGGSGGERGGGVAPKFPSPLPWGGGPWPPAQPAFFSSTSPLGIYVQPGLPGSPGRRARPGRPSVGQPGGGGGGGCQCAVPPGARPGGPVGRGWGGLFAAVCSPAFPGWAPMRVASSVPRPPCCIPGCRRSAAAQGAPLSAGAELPVGSGH